MSRALLILATQAERDKASRWAQQIPWNSRVEFKAPKRTLPQNDRMWAMLTDVAAHMKATRGIDYDTDAWKAIFLHGWGREVTFLPSLDGKSVVPVPQSSSDLSKEEMTDFIEYIFKEGAERGVVFHEPQAASPAHASRDSDNPPSTGAVAPGGPAIQSEPATGLPPPDAVGSELAPPGSTATEAGVEAADPQSVAPASEVSMVNSARPMNTEAIKVEMVKKVLQLAGDKDLTVEQRLDILAARKPDWLEKMPGFGGVVARVFNTAAKIVKGELKPDAGRQFMERLL